MAILIGETIHPSRPSGQRDATYLTHTKSGSVVFAATPLEVVMDHHGVDWMGD